MGEKRLFWLLLTGSLVAVSLSVATAIAFVVQQRRAEALVDIATMRSELEIALTSVGLRLANVGANIRRTPELSATAFTRIVAETLEPIGQRRERALALILDFSEAPATALDDYLARQSAAYAAANYPPFKLFPEFDGDSLMPAVLVEPAAARRGVFGFNIGVSGARRRAAREALATGELKLTRPIALSQDTDAADLSFLLVYPLSLPGIDMAGKDSAGLLAASLTPKSLFENLINQNSRTVIDIEMILGGGDPLTVRLGAQDAVAAAPLLISSASNMVLAPIRLPGVTVPITASAYYAPVLRDAVLPLIVLLVSILVCSLIWIQLRIRERHNRELETAIEIKEAELRTAERINSRTQRMESLGRLVGGVAHDFNNLLHVIMGNMELLATRPLDDRAKKFTSSALAATKRGAHLTQQLLAFGRRSHLRPERTDVALVIRETASMLERVLPESITIAIEHDPDLQSARIDPAGLENALLNLALNASDAMNSKGIMKISARNQAVAKSATLQPGDEHIPEGSYVAISVVDNGMGMNECVQERAFEPFFTTKKSSDGSGLGLPSVLGFCRQSGGGCQITSTPGLGTTVTLLLPVATDAREVRLKGAAPRIEASARGRVLLAEDEVAVAALLKQQLEQAGHRVTLVGTGDEALAVLKDNGPFDLLITDAVMPGNHQGVDIIEFARATAPNTAVLMISGYAESAQERSQHYPMLTKPVPVAELLSTVNGLLSGRAATASEQHLM